QHRDNVNHYPTRRTSDLHNEVVQFTKFHIEVNRPLEQDLDGNGKKFVKVGTGIRTENRTLTDSTLGAQPFTDPIETFKQRLIKKSILLPDDVLDSQCVRHLMESKIHTIFTIQKSFHEVFHGEYDDAERGIHFTLMIALRDR